MADPIKKVIVLGAGRSAYSLIHFLADAALNSRIHLSLIDASEEGLEMYSHLKHVERRCHQLDDPEFKAQIGLNDVVVSMLPARLHPKVATWCLENKTHLVTASYVSEELEAMRDEVESNGLIFMNEVGLDPGLDHMSAMRLIHEIQSGGGEIVEFESFTGGLVAEPFENNPWKYKFTWNPRNVVTAGQGGAVKFIHNGRYKYIPYHRLFRRTERINLDGIGVFEGYANRDSLKYRSTYNLNSIQTMYRGTLRRTGFCKAWNCLVQLGLTDDSFEMDVTDMTYRDFTNAFLSYHSTDSVELKLKQYLGIDQDEVELWEKLESIGLFEKTEIPMTRATPAQVLQHMLEERWSLEPTDRDRIVMWHKLIYHLNGEFYEVESQMQCVGVNSKETAMARTVGLPAAMATLMIAEEKIIDSGVLIPVAKHWFDPLLNQMEHHGIVFEEKTRVIEPRQYP